MTAVQSWDGLEVGFVIVGVMPDANGWGKPDIFMAKRVKSARA